MATAGSVTISFDLFANNYGRPVVADRHFTVDPAQNVAVNILSAGAGTFTNSTADILAVLYDLNADPTATNPNPLTRYSFTQSLAASTYHLQFAETDNQGFFHMGLDNVSVLAAAGAVPEPATLGMMILGFGAIGFGMRRRPTVRTAVRLA